MVGVGVVMVVGAGVGVAVVVGAGVGVAVVVGAGVGVVIVVGTGVGVAVVGAGVGVAVVVGAGVVAVVGAGVAVLVGSVVVVGDGVAVVVALDAVAVAFALPWAVLVVSAGSGAANVFAVEEPFELEALDEAVGVCSLSPSGEIESVLPAHAAAKGIEIAARASQAFANVDFDI